MAAYASESEIQKEFKSITWSAVAGGIEATTVTRWTEEESAIIDSYLGGIYKIPITGTQSLLTVKKICILMVSSRVKRTLQVKNIDPATQNQVSDDEYKQSIKILEDLRDQVNLLPDAPRIETASSNKKVFYSAEPPTFKKGTEQW